MGVFEHAPALSLADGLSIVSVALSVLALAVTVFLYRRQFTVGARLTAAREAAGQLLVPVLALEEDLRAHSARDAADPLDGVIRRWNTAVEPLRRRLGPDLASRVASLEYVLERTQGGVLPASEPGWVSVWIGALADVRAAAENYSRGLRPEPAMFPSVNELKELIVKGRPLGTASKDIVETYQRRMLFSRQRPPTDKWLAMVVACSVLLGASALFLVLSVAGVVS